MTNKICKRIISVLVIADFVVLCLYVGKNKEISASSTSKSVEPVVDEEGAEVQLTEQFVETQEVPVEKISERMREEIIALIHTGILGDRILQDERVICCYEGMSDCIKELPGGDYRFAVYKETVNKDIIFAAMLYLNSQTQDLYQLELEDETYVKLGNLEEFNVDVSAYDMEEAKDEESKTQYGCWWSTECYRVLKQREDFYALMPDGEAEFLGKKYDVVSSYTDSDGHILRQKSYYIDTENGNIYEYHMGIDTRDELYYIGNLMEGKEKVEIRPFFEDFAPMDYCLFLETDLGYGVSLDYFRYGIYGDMTSTFEEGENLYFALNEKMTSEKTNLHSHEEWGESTIEHICDVSGDLQWMKTKKYRENYHALYDFSIYKDFEKIAEIRDNSHYYAQGRTAVNFQKSADAEGWELIQEKKIQNCEKLIKEIWDREYCTIESAGGCFDESGSLIAFGEPNHQTIDLYRVEDMTQLYRMTIPELDEDWWIEISQVVGNEESGFLVFSDGNITWKMTYPDGNMEKLGEYMYSTTFSPDGKYMAYCTANAELDDNGYLLCDDDIKYLKYLSICEKWNTIPVGWYVVELETGNRTYIPVETWEQDDRPRYWGRAVWVEKDKLIKILQSDK